jgi:hypothetical protein
LEEDKRCILLTKPPSFLPSKVLRKQGISENLLTTQGQWTPSARIMPLPDFLAGLIVCALRWTSSLLTCDIDGFKAYQPQLYKEYSRLQKDLNAHTPRRSNIKGTVFESITVNVGPQTVCDDHTDAGNKAAGFCTLTASGDYDHTKGGHLVLWDLKAVIEFPTASTILLPSALLRHSNTLIQPGETRYSITQYTAGALFRWADNGMKCDWERLAELDDEGKTLRDRCNENRWNEDLNKFAQLKFD